MGWTRDFRFALRTLFRSKMVALVAIASLALIVAGNTVVFSIVNSLLIRPLDFDPEARLMLVWRKELARTFDRRAMSAADFNDYRERNRVFEDLAAYRGVSRNLTGAGEPEELTAAMVQPSFFRLVEVSTYLGRTFTDDEGVAGAGDVAVLAYDFFERRFGGDAGVVGTTIRLDRRPYEVVGVMQAGFEFVDTDLDVWLPLAVDPAAIERGDATIWPAVGKLEEGKTPQQARDDLAAIAADLEKNHPEANRGIGVDAFQFREFQPGPQDAQLFQMMQGAGIFLLLIACANLANLLLARGQVRQRELALRSALGASRARIVRQLVTESVVLATAGGALGIGLGFVGVEVLKKALRGDIPALYTPVVDTTVLAFSLGLSVVAGLVFGTFPALRSTGGALVENLKEGGGKSTSGSRGWVRKTLVVAQVSLALVLLCGTGFLLKSFAGLQYADPGFDQERLLTFQVTLPDEQYDEPAKRLAFFDNLLPELSAIPGAAGAAMATSLPRTYQNRLGEVEIADQPVEEGRPKPMVTWLSVSPGYFDVMSIPLLRGRGFTLADNADATRVAVVDRRFAERFWPGEDALGRRLELGGEERMVVGVAADVMHRRLGDFEGPLNSTVYLPWPQNGVATARFLMRSSSDDPTALAGAVRSAVWKLDADLPVAQVRTYDEVLASTYIGMSVFGRLLGGFGVIALLLAALGVYGVLAYSVTQRTREIGVRAALGASRGRLLGMVLRDGVGLAAVGLAVGLPAVWGVGKMLEGVIQGLTSGWTAFVPLVVAVLLGVILAASFAPARRAAAMSPVQALRAE